VIAHGERQRGTQEEQDMADLRYVVVGGGLAGAKAVEGLRESGATGPVTLLAAEPDAPYERPPLTKEFLKGEKDFDDFRAQPEDWYTTHDVDLRFRARATSLDRAARTVTLEDGSTLPYDRLLIATGADPLKLPVPGADTAELHYLRRLPQSRRLRDAISPGGRRVVIVGAGWIGLEVAAAARGYGNEVTVVEMGANPLERALGAEVGAFFGRVHREEGVDLRTGAGVAAFESSGEVTTVVDTAGNRFEADVVVVGAGIRPAIGLGKDAGLEVGRGILTNAALQTSDPAIWAAGDAAEAYHPYLGRHLHVEHWAFALNSGKAAGQSMAGQDVTFDRVPYFFTDQYDVGMEYAGTHGDGDELRLDGDLERAGFEALWLDADGRVTAGMHVNRWDAMDRIRSLVSERARI
jgi:3-phenylpropionate/trans-cinnamate dioxygenase ferredoxin reductase subunit